MPITLADLTYRVAREMGILTEGVATGGSATTIADTVDRTEPNDFWNGGTAWILYDAAGAGASPEGKYAKVTDFANTGGVITMTTVTDAVAAGDRYAVATKMVPLETLISKVNQALQELGPVPLFNTTQITIAANQTEYALSTAIRDVRRIQYQTVDDANDNRWREMRGWEIQPNVTAGSADTIIFPFQLATAYDVKIDYMAEHPEMWTYSSYLYDAVPPELVVYPAVAECFRYRAQRSGWQREFVRDMNHYLELSEKMRQSRSIRNVIKKPHKLLIVGEGVEFTIDDSTPNKVYLNR